MAFQRELLIIEYVALHVAGTPRQYWNPLSARRSLDGTFGCEAYQRR